MQQFIVEGYELRFSESDKRSNAWVSHIPFPYTVTIRDPHKKQIVTMPYASQVPITTRQDAARAFYTMLNVALLGALHPMDWCQAMGIDPYGLGTQERFEDCRLVTEKIYAITEFERKGKKLADLIHRIKSNMSKETK